MGEFSGRTVLITGALGTLGSAQTQAFAALGPTLLLLDLPGDARGDRRVAEVALRHPDTKARYVGLDLRPHRGGGDRPRPV
jgi:NAD(P)-dependent dehydrogenase (short-subunit alcohol dehydrogenase family)